HALSLSESVYSKSNIFYHLFIAFFFFQVSADGIASQNDWPYAIHLLGHIYAGDINSARFLWKSMDSAIKDSQPEVIAVWKIGQKLWTRDYGGVYEAVRSFNWSPEIQPIVAAFEGRVSLLCLTQVLSLCILVIK
ncbi:COP9 signalosome complex subunit 8, partial [Bienertia sinuspersici]